ncbi:sigma 54-interacting transcriptional regulator [candidate division TA06 bacterium]|nr:sigma 54-interacting transcriptional regulator [candidate division TA06 bacterium]
MIMEQTLIREWERSAFKSTQDLWMLLAAITAVEDECERTRLTATGIPSLVRCNFSGMALRKNTEPGWSLALQKDGELLASPEAEAVIAELKPLYREAIGSGKFLSLRMDKPRDIPIPPSLERFGVQCLAVVPLQTLSSKLGILLIGKEEPEEFSPEEKYVLLRLAEQLAIALENLRLQKELKRYSENLQEIIEERTSQLRKSEERQRVLLEVNNAIIANLDKERLFDAVAQSLHRILTFDRASITLYEPVKDSFMVYALAGAIPPKQFVPIGTEFPRQGSHLQSVLDQREPLIRYDLEKEERIGAEEQLLKEGIRSYVSVPLMVKGWATGVLSVGSHNPNGYTTGDAEFLQEVAKQIALAIENMKAYEEIAQLKSSLEQENIYLQEEIKTEYNFEEVIGQSSAIKKVLKAVETVAPTGISVLISGETGTGKELIARALHNLSPRREKPLVKVNCAALPSGLIESELFGHEKGAFTGALSLKIGRFELADGGTIFLDEIGDLPIDLQAKLLHVLQEGEFERVGSSETHKVDVRVIAATNRDLEKAMEKEKFRQDLFYRLNVFPVQVPSLRERKEDIPFLVRFFVQKYSVKLGREIETIPRKTMEVLKGYPWPGNIRELENIIERAVLISRSTQLELGDWIPKAGIFPQGIRIRTLKEYERQHIIEVLEYSGWKVSGERGAAKFLGLKPTTLEARMKKLGIKRRE